MYINGTLLTISLDRAARSWDNTPWNLGIMYKPFFKEMQDLSFYLGPHVDYPCLQRGGEGHLQGQSTLGLIR